MYKRLDLNETNISDRCYSRSSSKRKISVVSRPSSKRVEQPIEIKSMLNGFLGCSKGKIISQKDIESVIDMEVKRKLSICQPNIALSLQTIPSENDKFSIEKGKILWSPNSPINRLLTLQ